MTVVSKKKRKWQEYNVPSHSIASLQITKRIHSHSHDLLPWVIFSYGLVIVTHSILWKTELDDMLVDSGL